MPLGTGRLTCPRCSVPLGPGQGLETLCAGCLYLLALSDAATDQHRPAAREPDTLLAAPLPAIDRYRLLRLVGEGGMGLVYLAEQEEPFRRSVALKILKRVGETPEVLARFDLERQALATLHHPAIAQVYDAGTAPDGRPFIVMEYVPGQPLTEYCDERRLDIGGRLQLFVSTCEAVHHANRNGIVHRDLKPANILVTEEGGRPMIKIIDFGLAKAIQPRLTERTLFTRVGTLMGTPTYMSPEQADPAGYRVDQRSDVYSLGVILYELLVGATPFDPQELRAAGTLEVLRTLREREPPRLAARLRAGGADARRIAGCRQTDPARLVRLLQGDLQCIVQKALEKTPDQRYADVRALAADVERFLRHEPSQAARSALGYRTRKFAARNRLLAGAVAIGLLALGLGLATSRWLFDRPIDNATSGAAARPVDVHALTRTGDAWHGVISPDGRYVVFVQEPRERLDGRTLWLADRTTWGAERLPVPPTTETPGVMGWSRDGRHLYYGVLNRGNDGTYSVYRYSLAERRTDLVSARANGGVLSPDERQLANARNDPAAGRSVLVVQDLRNSAERIVAMRSLDDPYTGSLAWSPDGRTLSTSVGEHGTPKRILGVEIADGRERSLSVDAWHYAGAKVWLPDGRTLLIAGEKSGQGERNSLYRLDTQTGASVRIETGLEHISGWQLSASADGRTVAATHSWFAARLFAMPDADSARALDLGSAVGSPAFLPNNRLLFTGDDGHPWVVEADGANRRRFSSDLAVHAAASADGRVLIASKRVGGFLTLWRMPTDGSPLTSLPERRAAWLSDVTPDGRWIVYVTGDDGALWKLATAGGEPVQLLSGTVGALSVAPDNSTVVVLWQQSSGPWQLGVVPLQGGGFTPRGAVPAGTSISAGIHVSRHGAAVDLVRIAGNVGNLWRVPLGLGTPLQLTHFDSERIQSFDWSQDGRLLAVIRGGWRGDIVLLRGETISPGATWEPAAPASERLLR